MKSFPAVPPGLAFNTPAHLASTNTTVFIYEVPISVSHTQYFIFPLALRSPFANLIRTAISPPAALCTGIRKATHSSSTVYYLIALILACVQVFCQHVFYCQTAQITLVICRIFCSQHIMRKKSSIWSVCMCLLL